MCIDLFPASNPQHLLQDSHKDEQPNRIAFFYRRKFVNITISTENFAFIVIHMRSSQNRIAFFYSSRLFITIENFAQTVMGQNYLDWCQNIFVEFGPTSKRFPLLSLFSYISLLMLSLIYAAYLPQIHLLVHPPRSHVNIHLLILSFKFVKNWPLYNRCRSLF